MKKKPKKSNSPDASQSRLRKEIVHLFRLVAFSAGLIVLLALFHLLTLGIPDALTQRIVAQAKEQGIPLHIESISLSPHRGWALHNIRLYSSSPDDLTPILQSKKLYVHIWPDDWRDLKQTGWNLILFSKKADLSLGHTWETSISKKSPYRSINLLRSTLHIDRNNLHLKNATLNWGGINFRAAGCAEFSDQKKEKGTPWHLYAANSAPELINRLSVLDFHTPPELNFHFDVHSGQPEKNEIKTTLTLTGLYYNQVTYESLHGDLSLSGNTLALKEIALTHQANHTLQASGTYQLDTQQAQLHLENSLLAPEFIALLPESIHSALDHAQLEPFGTLNFTAECGPAPIDTLFENIQVQAPNIQITRQDLTLDPLSFTLTRKGNELTVDKILGTTKTGTLGGNFKIDLPSRAWSTSLHGVDDPTPIGTFVGPYLEVWLDRFKFLEAYPDIRVEMSHTGIPGSLNVDGTVNVSNLICAKRPLANLNLNFTYGNRVLNFPEIHADREQKKFDGSVRVDFETKLAHYKAVNDFYPHVISDILTMNKSSILDRFEFTGEVQSEGAGIIDYGTWSKHAFHGKISGDNVSFNGIPAESFQTDIVGQGTELIMTNTVMHFCGGIVEGTANFDTSMADGSAPYQMDIQATDLRLKELLSELSESEREKTTGRTSFSFNFSADAKQEFWDSVDGSGSVKIEKGQLAHLPLFGGLSRAVQSTLPGFKLFTITSLSADYVMQDQHFQTQNLRFGGPLLGASARGNYSPTDGLHFRLRAIPLSRTDNDKKWYQLHLWGAEVISRSTAQLFRLIEMEVTGPLDSPTWKPSGPSLKKVDL